MNETTNTEHDLPVINNGEIFTDIKALFNCGKELIDDGYAMTHSLDGHFNTHLYVYEKDTNLGKSIYLLYISETVTRRMNNGDWNQASTLELLKDCENICYLAEASDLVQLKKDNPDIDLLDYFFSLLDGFKDACEAD